jgi:hypothetical protein
LQRDLMRPRHDSNAHDVPAPQAGALSRLSYGGKKATSPLPSRRAHDVTPAAGAREIGSTARRVPVRRTRVSRENCDERMQFSKDASNYTRTSVHAENWGDRWDSHPLRLASQASASRTSASTTMAGPERIERPSRGLESRSSPRHGPRNRPRGPAVRRSPRKAYKSSGASATM